MSSGTPKKTSNGAVRCTELLRPDAFHLKRVDCSLQAAQGGEPMRVRLLLNDFKPEGVSLFCPQRLAPGSKAKLVIQEPRALVLPGQVQWLKECMGPRRVFRESMQCYRVGLHFEFPTPEEAAQFKAWCEELARAFPGKAA